VTARTKTQEQQCPRPTNGILNDSKLRKTRARHIAMGQPTMAIGAESSVPEPSRRISGFGNSTPAPPSVEACTGYVPTKARINVSCPLRKRCERTPPVPRPFVGYISNGVTFAEPFSVPGSASESPATVNTTAPDAENRPLSPSS